MRCPNCAEQLPAGADRCPSCGDDLGAYRDGTPGPPGSGGDGRSGAGRRGTGHPRDGDDRRGAGGSLPGEERSGRSTEEATGDGWDAPSFRESRDTVSGEPGRQSRDPDARGPVGAAGHSTRGPSERPGARSGHRAGAPDRAGAGRGTTGGTGTGVEPHAGGAATGHPDQGSPFELALKYPFSRGWRTTGGWTLAFWAVFLGLLAVAVVAADASGIAESATGTLATAVLVVGPLPYLGYLLRTSRAAARGESRAPAFGGLRENLALGVRVLAGFLAVQFLAVLPLLPVLLLAGEQPSSGAALALGLLVFVVLVLLGYLVPAFLTVLAVTGSLRTAFGTRRVAEFAFTTDYFVASLIGFVLLIVLRLVAVLSVLTIVGWIVLVPYAFVAVAAYWGEVYRKQVGAVGSDGPAPADGRASDAD